MLITNASPNSWKYSVYKFCLAVMKWQLDRGKGFLVITPPDSGFAQFLPWKKHQKDRIKYHIGCTHVDMTNHCLCHPSIKDLRVYYNHDEDFDLMESTACLQERREALVRSTVEGVTFTFVFIHCTLHATCSMEGHETELSV